MNSTNLIQRSWWRRLARRTRAEAPRTNRLSHFEPLEQRTVLSAGFGMDDDFWHNPHQGHYEVGGDTMLVAHHGQGPGGSHDEGLHLGLGKHDAFAYSDSIDVAPSLVNQPMTLMPLASAPSFSSDVDSYLDDEIESSEGESPAGIAPLSTSPISSSPLSNSLLSSSITPTPMLVAPQSPAALTYRVEIVV